MDRPKLIAAPIDLADRDAFRLGRLIVDPLAREIRFDHRSERVEPQPMKVLVLLADKRGEVVTRDELIERCWSARYVSDDVVNRSILLLRRIAKSSSTFTIETVPKAGYRLTEIEGQQASSRPWPLWSAAAATAILSVAAIFMLRGPADQSHPPLAAIELAPFVAAGDPLTGETAKASDTAVADMLANSGLPVLRPRAAGSQGRAADLRLSGQLRSVGDRVEASLQLDDIAHGTLLLSHRFIVSHDQAKLLPEQIGAFAATSLATTGALMALDRQRPGDRRLTGELLRQWSMMIVFEDVAATYQSVDRIAAQMPDSAIAQLGLAMSTVHMLPLLPAEERPAALAKGRAAAARARELAPGYGDVAVPDCNLYSPARLDRCEAVLRAAFKADPTAPFVAAAMRNHLVSVGRFNDALDYDRLAVAAMPYMAGRRSASTLLLEALGQRDPAEQQFQRVRRWWPEFDLIFGDRLEGMLDRGDIEDAAAFVAAMPAGIDVIDRAAVRSIAADVVAKRPLQLRARCLSEADSLSYFCLVAMLRSNDLDGAFAIADRMFPRLVAATPAEEDRLFLQHPGRSELGMLSSPALARLRADLRFITIAERVGLLRYWREGHLPDFCRGAAEPVCARIAHT